MNGEKVLSLGLVAAASCALLTGCASSTGGSESGTGNHNTNSTTSATGQHPSSASNSTSPAGSSKPISSAPSWPTISIQTVGKLPQGIEGNTLALSAQGPVSVGGYTGAVSITGVYKLLPQPSELGRLPERTHDAAAAFLNQNLYVFGGGQATSYNTIVQVQKGLGRDVARLSAPLSDASALPLTWKGQNAIAVIGGYDGSTFRQSAEVFTVSSGKLQAQPLFDMKTPVRYPALASADGKIYIVGGKTVAGTPTPKVYVWSQQTGLKATPVTLRQGLEKAAAFVWGNDLIVAGGKTQAGAPQKSIIAYSLSTGKAKTVGELPSPLADMGYVQDGHTGYLAGGVTSATGRPTASIVKILFK